MPFNPTTLYNFVDASFDLDGYYKHIDVLLVKEAKTKGRSASITIYADLVPEWVCNRTVDTYEKAGWSNVYYARSGINNCTAFTFTE